MLHRVSLETSAEDNKSLEAIYSNSWIQANKKKIGNQSKTLGSSQHDLGHVDPLEVQAICLLEGWPFQGSGSHDNNKSDSFKDVGASCHGKAERGGAANHRENRGRSHLCGQSGRICNNQVLFAAIFAE